MRSELVFAAERTLSNRYSLCRLVSMATRKFHRPNSRVEETTDAVLRHIANASDGLVKLDSTEIQGKTPLLVSDTAELRAY
ncbi:MAG: DNA-directed RNA polymerase subunit omega [Candidatus Korobacteraceae bacterium]